MCVVCSITYATAGTSLLLATANAPLSSLAVSKQQEKAITSQVEGLQELPTFINSVKMPTIEDPQWLKKQKAAEAAAQAQRPTSSKPVSHTVTYDVMSRGVVGASLAEFRAQANQTLNDARGWARMGVAFQEVASGGMFTLVLSSADQMTSFSSGCSAEWSCRAGRYVIINQDRWTGSTAAWRQGGGSLRDYRHTVINHEIGHWLGHGHATCNGAGQLANIMQQQSIDLQGCKINPWPLEGELTSPTLGI